MSQTHINIRENDVKRIAHSVKSLINDTTPSHMQLLNAICDGLWGKHYEEAKATLMAANDVDNAGQDHEVVQPKVHLISYGDETILAVNGRYVLGDFPGTDLETPWETMAASAQELALQHECPVTEVDLPKILHEDYETEDIIDLARRLGYFRYHKPLFERLLHGIAVSYEGKPTEIEFSLGFMEEQFWECYEDSAVESDPSKAMCEKVFWEEFTPLEIAVDFSNYMLRWSLHDIGSAEKLDDGGWFIPYRGSDSGAGEIIHVLIPS